MWKYLSALLALCLLVVGGVAIYQHKSALSAKRDLNNQIAKLEKMVKETETAYSSRGQELEDLKSSNKELQNKIEGKDEEVAALGQIILNWKEQYFKIKNATQTVVDASGKPTDVCDSNSRVRVDFAQTQDFLHVEGFTLTNPAEAELSVKWTRGLKLEFVLARNKDKTFRLYLDTGSPDVVPADLTLKVDPSVFELKWYEKISIGGSLNVGQGLATSFNLGYEFTDALTVGPNFVFYYDGKEARKLYGANVLYYPFR